MILDLSWATGVELSSWFGFCVSISSCVIDDSRMFNSIYEESKTNDRSVIAGSKLNLHKKQLWEFSFKDERFILLKPSNIYDLARLLLDVQN